MKHEILPYLLYLQHFMVISVFFILCKPSSKSLQFLTTKMFLSIFCVMILLWFDGKIDPLLVEKADIIPSLEKG